MADATAADSFTTWVALLAASGAVGAVAANVVVRKMVETAFKPIELRIANASLFAQKVQDQRFSLVIEVSRKLESIWSDIERIVKGGTEARDQLAPHNELRGLTEVHEELRVIRAILGGELSSALEQKAKLASVVASQWEHLHIYRDDFQPRAEEWAKSNDRIHAALAEVFGFPG